MPAAGSGAVRGKRAANILYEVMGSGKEIPWAATGTGLLLPPVSSAVGVRKYGGELFLIWSNNYSKCRIPCKWLSVCVSEYLRNWLLETDWEIWKLNQRPVKELWHLKSTLLLGLLFVPLSKRLPQGNCNLLSLGSWKKETSRSRRSVVRRYCVSMYRKTGMKMLWCGFYKGY